MAFYCPLCFEPLDANTVLERICLDHRVHETFPLENEYGRALCPRDLDQDQCNSVRQFQNGVFIAHVGCIEENPFWTGNATVVPGSLTRNGHALNHWMMGALAQIAVLAPGRREMWFPLSLFRTVNRLQGGDNRPSGRVVKLLGDRAAGKTVLAYMALSGLDGSRLAYAPADTFVYISPDLDPRTRSDEFAKALLPFSLLEQGDTLPDWIAFTVAKRKANIKAGLFVAAGPSAGGPIRQVFRALSTGVERPLFLAFYDNAGEDLVAAFDSTRAVNILTDRAVVVLDASRLGKFTSNPSANAIAAKSALRHLQTFEALRARSAIVLTKLDLVPCPPDLLDAIRAGSDTNDTNARQRQIAIEWLCQFPSSNEAILGRYLKAHGNTEVFFLWTEGLGQFGPGHTPKPYGVARLVEWCLQ